jgi:hypothetical protein
VLLPLRVASAFSLFQLTYQPVTALQVDVNVTANIISRKKGTPGLKPNVHCLGFSGDPDTEAASDWQGFA